MIQAARLFGLMSPQTETARVSYVSLQTYSPLIFCGVRVTIWASCIMRSALPMRGDERFSPFPYLHRSLVTARRSFDPPPNRQPVSTASTLEIRLLASAMLGLESSRIVFQQWKDP
jgi:hypothetical protein